MASSSSSSLEKYPYPSHVDVGVDVPCKLSQTNYFMWSNLMASLIEDEGLMGFLNGTITAPPEKITVPDDSSSTGGTKEMKNEDYIKWKKRDLLLRGWILGRLNEDILENVQFQKTAKEVWEVLARLFGTQVPPSFLARVAEEGDGKSISGYVPLHKAALAGDWETASSIIEKEPDAVRAKITADGETALVVAVQSKKRNAFVKKLLEKMLSPDVALTENNGATALHFAAMAGNIEAAKLLVKKDPKLPNVEDFNKALPINRAAIFGRREMVLYLFTVTQEDGEQKPYEGESGGRLLHALIQNEVYDVALFLLQRYPKLAWDDPSPLRPIAGQPHAFPSGKRFNIWQKLIYS
ncbi:hypothetical protein RJ640_006213, partial [Escallonia rubra]